MPKSAVAAAEREFLAATRAAAKAYIDAVSAAEGKPAAQTGRPSPNRKVAGLDLQDKVKEKLTGAGIEKVGALMRLYKAGEFDSALRRAGLKPAERRDVLANILCL